MYCCRSFFFTGDVTVELVPSLLLTNPAPWPSITFTSLLKTQKGLGFVFHLNNLSTMEGES